MAGNVENKYYRNMPWSRWTDFSVPERDKMAICQQETNFEIKRRPKSLDSLGEVVTRLRAGRSWVQIPAELRYFFILQTVQTAAGT